jgi:hypothetical protein
MIDTNSAQGGTELLLFDWSKHKSERVVLMTFAALTAQGMLSAILDNNFFLFNPTTQLEICFFVLALLNFNPPTEIHFLIFISFSIILITCILLSKNAGTTYYDSLRALKWLSYLAVIWSSSSIFGFDLKYLISLYKMLIVSSALSYMIQIIRDGFGTRPTLFTENNYEISLLAGLFVIIITHSKLGNSPLETKWFLALMLVISLSGSRSGALAGIIATFSFIGNSNSLRRLQSLKILIGGLSSAIAIYTFVTRGAKISETDRFSFFQVFLSESETRTILNWLFGNFIIRPLSDSACSNLSYYQILVSDPIYGTCYSVILHSFILRILWDFGALGLTVSFLGLFFRMRSQLPKNLPKTLILLALANAISVSGPNNVYVVFPILLAILAERNFKVLLSAKQSVKRL